MKYITILLFLSLTSNVWSQKVSFRLANMEALDVEVLDPAEEMQLYPAPEDDVTVPDRQAYYPGGWEALDLYFREEGKLNDPQLRSGGQIFIAFVINEDGLAEDIKVLKAFNNEPCDREAVRLIRNMPRWIPAEDNGQKVASKIVLPILVELE